jgi:hypothetical protein
MNDDTSNQNTESISANRTQQRGTEDASMTDTTALTPIRGSNGYQQQVPIDASQPLDLSVTNARGEIRVQASDQPNVWVVVRSADGRSQEEPVQVTVSIDGNRISIHPSWQVASGLSGFARKLKDQLQNGLNTNDWKFDNLKFSPDLDYDIRVEVPRALLEGSRISAKTASGSIEAVGLHAATTIASASGSVSASSLDGRVAIHSASGSVAVMGVKGSLEVNTASGSIKVEEGEAWLALRTVSGSIKIDRFTMKNARITTVSGSVKGSAIVNNDTDYSFETVSGSLNLNVVLPADSTTLLNFKSLSGSATVAGAWQSDAKRMWHAGNGAAGPTIRVKTVSGSMNLNAHVEPTIPTRHEALPEPVFTEASDDSDQSTRPFTSIPAIPSIPPIPPTPSFGTPTRAAQSGRPQGGNADSASGASNGPTSGNLDETQPLFTPPADWPDWIKSTARTVEETARHVVTSFQQPVEPLTPAEAQPAEPAEPAKSANAAPPAATSPLPTSPSPAPWASKPADMPPASDLASVEQPDVQAVQAVSDHRSAVTELQQAPSDLALETAAADLAGHPKSVEAPVEAVTQAEPTLPEPLQAAAAASGDIASLDDQDEADRLRILEALERGDIDIDEALSRIEQKDAKGA